MPNHSCVCSTPKSMINLQVDIYLFYKEKSVMAILSTSCHCISTLTICIYDAYMVIRRTCNYRDSTLSKNHPIIYLTHLLHPSSHSSPYLSYLALTPMVIIPSPHTYLHSSVCSPTWHPSLRHSLLSLYHS